MNIVFVKVDRKYTIGHVNDLYNQLYKYAPNFKYYCYTDDMDQAKLLDQNITPLQIDPKLHLSKVWNKLHMFSSNFPVKGKIIYFDLDTIIQDDPFTVIDQLDFDKITMVKCHWKPDSIVRLTNYDVTINSSILAWDSTNPQVYQLWDHFANSGYRDYFVKKYAGIDRYIVHEDFDSSLFSYFPTDYIMSYKYEDHDKNAPVITFEELDFGSINFKPRS